MSKSEHDEDIDLEPVTLELVQGLKGRVPLGFFRIPANASPEFFEALADFISIAAEEAQDPAPEAP